MLFSCSKDAENIAPTAQDNSLINNAMEHFNTSVLTGIALEAQTQSANSSNYRQHIIKNANWTEAKTVQLSVGEAVQVPLNFSKELYAQVKNGKSKLALSSVSYLLLYRNTRGWQTEVVTRLPDAAYLANTAINKSFTGMVLVENWQGSFIRGYSYGGDGTVKKLLAPRVKGPSSDTQVMNELSSCTITDWYSVSGNYSHYMYSEMTCTEGGYGGGSYSDGSEGGHHDGDYGDGNGSGYPSSDDYSDAPLEPRKVVLVEVSFDSSFTKNVKLDCIYTKLNSSGTLNKIIKNFMGQNSLYDLVWKGGVYSDNTLGGTYPPQYPYTDPVAIVIDTIKSNNRPSLMVAKTLLHEAIHAQLTGWAQSVNYTLTPANFPGLFDYYTRYGPQEGDHQLMAAHYIDVLATGLSEYDNNLHNRSFYEAIAWEGLIGTTVWNSKLESEKKTILTTITDFIQNGSKQCK